jgi:hypothetical protein
VFLRDEEHWLYLLDRKGTRQAQFRAPKDLTCSACSEDGLHLAAGGRDGDLWWLAPDLMPRWQLTLGKRVEAVALDALGHHVAASDSAGGLHLFTRRGRPVWSYTAPRPLRFLTFVPESAFLLASADLGFVACLDAKGKLTWRDAPMSNVGSLAVSGSGARVVLACYSDGLGQYSVSSGRPHYLPQPEPVRLACLAYDGTRTLTADLKGSLTLRSAAGQPPDEHRPEEPATTLALFAPGDRFVTGSASGTVRCCRWA